MISLKQIFQGIMGNQQNPLYPDIDRRQPGGGGGAKGVYSKSAPHCPDNSMTTAGSSWSKQGNPGWSSAMGEYIPPGEMDGTTYEAQPEDELPDEMVESKEEEKEELPGNDFLNKSAPVGSPIPGFKSNTSPTQKRGKGFFRR